MISKLRTLVTINAVAYGIPFFAGMFNVDLSGFITMFVGLAMLVVNIWMLFIVYGDDFSS